MFAVQLSVNGRFFMTLGLPFTRCPQPVIQSRWPLSIGPALLAMRDRVAKDSVDAALQPAKVAVGERNKVIRHGDLSVDQMRLLIQIGQKAVDDMFSDITDRLTRIERSDMGKGAADTSHRGNNNLSSLSW
jgi:hypothetical protein